MKTEPRQIVTDSVANELTEKICRAYAGLPAEHGRSCRIMPARNDGGGGDARCEDCGFPCEADPSAVDKHPGYGIL